MGYVSKCLDAAYNFRWLPSYLWQRLVRRSRPPAMHLIMAMADHFEPAFVPEAPATFAGRDLQIRRLEHWCREYPKLVDRWRDSDGEPFRHTYFYPAEQYDGALIDILAEHCQCGWGEIEIQLHHGVQRPDSPENTKKVLEEFRDALAARGCLSRLDGERSPRYGFVHGNWALANSAGGMFCGVDNEMQILLETGCYADFTLPSAPNRAQIGKINALYECALPLNYRAPHRRGRDLERGRPPRVFPLIVQGPLMLRFDSQRNRKLIPQIENAAVTTANPAGMGRLRLWQQAAITVRNQPGWLFIKLHCHGMDPRDEEGLLGEPMRRFLADVIEHGRGGSALVHFVTAREMVNIILAACDGRDGNPGDYRNYRLQLAAWPSTV